MIQPASNADQPIPFVAVPLLSLAAFASGMSMRVTDALLPKMAQEFGASLGDVSNVITFFAIAYGLSQLLFGPLGDRYGKYFVVACGSAACVVTASLCGLAPGFDWLLGARLLAGATAASIIPLAMAWIGDVVPYHQRQPVLARFLIGQIMGLSGGVLAGGFAADRFGWRLPFFVVALIFAAASAGLLVLNRRLPAHARATHRAPGSALTRVASEFGQVLARPWARTVLRTVFLEGAFLFGAFAFIASHLHRAYGMSLTASGALVMLFGGGGLAFAAASGALVKKMGETGLSLWGGIIAALSLLAVGAGNTWWWAVPGCIGCGLGFYMLHNTLQINATQMAPERRGAAVSAFASSFFLGQSAGVACAGLLVERAGTAAVIALGGIGVLLVALDFNRRLRHRMLSAQPHGA